MIGICYYITKPSAAALGIAESENNVVNSTESFGKNPNFAVLTLSRFLNLILNIQSVVFASSWLSLDGMKNGDSAKIL